LFARRKVLLCMNTTREHVAVAVQDRRGAIALVDIQIEYEHAVDALG
jgi:hypothetical protein